ncbi:DUF262 domain-containing protein [Sphingomonas albertensis]|uniref:DUF262 domain-containing protein n=1 Tax=Sphingomonas albertensis TaxID=2762591 RepID=A0ABR7ARF0_9SPHN|nr:DUF262 domain-containing protein [Sphingomonas albertensis]MBC3943043.1 DUF262 domain-containing protein [Sphingomonas albertensis]
MLPDEIQAAQRNVRTDAYQMSVGELVNLYETGELIVDPEFQRLFRWEPGQKSKLIESMLLGIPLPSIFVFETADAKWELVDGLQRLSTILEFMGKLRDPDGSLRAPSILEATRYLPSLHNTVWEENQRIDVPIDEQRVLEKAQQIAVRRSRLSVEILKRPSDDATKFDLFQRLNSGGTVANPQELRNSIVLMVSSSYFRSIKAAAESQPFRSIIGVKDEGEQKQRHIEFAMRFLVHTFVPYPGKLDVEEYIDEGIIVLARQNQSDRDSSLILDVFSLLFNAAGADALRREEGDRHVGRVGNVAVEAIAVGVARNIELIKALDDPISFVREKIGTFWRDNIAQQFFSSGVRGTSRIENTVPLGERWFKP